MIREHDRVYLNTAAGVRPAMNALILEDSLAWRPASLFTFWLSFSFIRLSSLWLATGFSESVFYESRGQDGMLFIFMDFTDKRLSKPQPGSFGSLGLESLLSLANTELGGVGSRFIPPTISLFSQFPVLIMLRHTLETLYFQGFIPRPRSIPPTSRGHVFSFFPPTLEGGIKREWISPFFAPNLSFSELSQKSPFNQPSVTFFMPFIGSKSSFSPMRLQKRNPAKPYKYCAGGVLFPFCSRNYSSIFYVNNATK